MANSKGSASPTIGASANLTHAPIVTAKPNNIRLLIGLLAGGVTANLLMLVFQFTFLRAFLIGACVAYLPTWFDGAQYRVTPREGSRYWPWFAELSIWKTLFSYFPASITTDYDFTRAAREGGQFVFAVHPHGMLSVDHGLFFMDAVGFLTKVLPAPRRDLGASVIFLVPFFRDFCLWLGCVDAGSSTANKVLSNGYSMQLYPGGIAEQIVTDSKQPKIVAKQRYGFIKLALSYDVPIVPVYVFGEDKLYTSISFGLKFRKWIAKVFRLGLPLFYGRLDAFGLLANPQPLEAVLGAPLFPKGVTPETQLAVYKQRLVANSSDALRREHNVATAATTAAASKSKSSSNGDGATSAPLPLSTPDSVVFTHGRRVRREVSHAEVEEMHDRYIAALDELFEKHKHKHPLYAQAKLEILSAK